MDFIFMLTHHDKTVQNCLDVYDSLAGIGLRHVGFKDVGVSLAARYGGREGWGLTGIAAYKRLLQDAEDSPVVDDEGDANQLFASLLVTYGF